jgi:peptide/nickel transport system substrate-binding protein
VLQSLQGYPYTHQTGELLQAMWTDVGFKVQHHIYEAAVARQKRRDRDFDADSTSASYRFDPDGWCSRHLLSTSPSTKEQSGFHNARVDQLIGEARRTLDKQKRLELYAVIDSIVNEELPILYLHHLTLLEAGTVQLKGYQPAISGLFTTRNGGIRTAWIG